MCKNKTCFPVGIALILGLLIGFGLHPANGLTDLGARVLAVTIPPLYLWLTVNTGWCALLFLGLLDGPMAWIQSQLWRFLGWSTSFVEILLGLGRAAGTAV